MTDTPNVESSQTTPSQPVTSPSTSKPYDDDILQSYAEESEKEAPKEPTTTAQEPIKEEPSKEEVDQKPEAEAPEKEKEENKATKDDQVIDGIEEVPLTKVINGKQVEFKVKDAVQAYMKQEEFNRNMDRRISQVSQREQRWDADQKALKDRIGQIIEVAQKGDFVTAARALAKIAFNGSGSDVVEFEKKYFDQLDKVREVYTKYTPEQREAYFAKRKLAEAEKRAAELEEEKAKTVATSQLQGRVADLQREYGLTEKEFWGHYKTLADSQVGEGKAFKALDEIAPEDVVRFSLAVRHEQNVVEAAKQLGIEDEAILDKISDVTANQSGMTVERIKKVIEASGIAKTASPSVVENLNRKAQKSGVQFNQASSTKKENDKSDGYDKETLEFLYRKQPRIAVRPQR